MKKYLKNKKGITFISLVITIIILIIVAGISITLALGKNGIFNKAKQAEEETNKQAATEKINLKITTAQMNSYAEKQEMPTLKELSLVLKEDKEIDYITEKSQIASVKYEVGEEPSTIYTKLKEYPYEFEIDSTLRLASINGIKVANNTVSRQEYEELLKRIERIENTEYVTKSELSNSTAGATYLTNSGTVNITNNALREITSIVLPKGNWIVLGTINLTCKYNRWCSLSGVTYSTSAHAYSNDSRNMTSTVVGYVKSTTSQTVYLNAGQNSGGTISCSGSICAIKLSDN